MLIVTDIEKDALAVDVSPELLGFWGWAEQPAQRLEAVAPFAAVTHRPQLLQGRDAVWFMDNANALFARVKGAAGCPHMNRVSSSCQLDFAGVGSRVYYE